MQLIARLALLDNDIKKIRKYSVKEKYCKFLAKKSQIPPVPLPYKNVDTSIPNRP